MKKLNVILLFLVLMIIPTQVFAIGEYNFIYYHFENSKIVEYYNALGQINEIFEKWFSWEKYISIILLGFIIAILLVTFDVIRGKQAPIVLLEKFIWNGVTDNIVTKFGLVVIGFWILLYPIPVVQVAPIVSKDTTTNEKTIIAWVVDKENSVLVETDDDNGGNNKLLHVPALLGVPLKYIEKFTYGFPSFPSDSVELVMNTKTQRKSWVNSHKSTTDLSVITTSSGACTTIANGKNVVTKDKVNSCNSALASLKPIELSLLGNTLKESAEIVENVATPFIYYKDIIKFQENFLHSLINQNDIELNQAKLLKSNAILEEMMKDPEISARTFKAIKEQYEERFKRVNEELSETLDDLLLVNKSLGSKQGMSAFLRIFENQVTLNRDFVTKKYIVEMSSNQSNDANIKDAWEKRMEHCKKLPDPQTKVESNISFVDTDCGTTYDSIKSKIEASNFTDKVAEGKSAYRISSEKLPFDITSDFQISFDIRKSQLDDVNTSNDKKNYMINEFWNNYNEYIFKKTEATLKTIDSFHYYDEEAIYKILVNLGYKHITEESIEKTVDNLSKIEKLQVHLFHLDALVEFLKNKRGEMDGKIFSQFSNDKTVFEDSVKFKKDYEKKIEEFIGLLKNQHIMLFGYIYDDYTFQVKIPNPDPDNMTRYLTQYFIYSIDPSSDQKCIETDGNYDCDTDYFISENKNFVKSFFCEDSADLDIIGACIYDDVSNKINHSTLNLFNNKTFGQLELILRTTSSKIQNADRNPSTKDIDVYNPCDTNPTNLKCAKHVEQKELLKLKNDADAPLSSITDTDFSQIPVEHAIAYAYAGNLRSLFNELLNSLSKEESYNMSNPTCNYQGTKGIVFSSIPESYSNYKNFLFDIMNIDEHQMRKINLYASSLSALGEEHLQIGKSGWTEGSGSPQLRLKDDFSAKILEAMEENIKGITFAEKTKRLQQIINEYKNVTATKEDDTYRKQLLLLVEYMANNSNISLTNVNVIPKMLDMYVKFIQSFYNREIVHFQIDTIGGLRNFSFNYNYIMGGNFLIPVDESEYDLIKKSIEDNSSILKKEIQIAKELCQNEKLENDELINKIDEMEGEDYEPFKGEGILSTIFAYIVNSILAIFILLGVMLPFFFILIFSIIATIIGWIGIVSIAYISIFNLIVLRNLDDFPIIKSNFKEPSEQLISYFTKAVLTSIFVFIYLIVTVFLVGKVLMPWIEILTMDALIDSLTNSEELELTIFFQMISFVFAIIFYVYMLFTTKIFKDWLFKEIISPTKMSMNRAKDFAQSLMSKK